MKIKLLALASLIATSNVWAKLDIELMKSVTPKFQMVNIVKENKQYFLSVKSHALFNNKGEQIDYSNRSRSYQVIRRNIKIPVKVELVEKSGFGNTVQFLGFGDDDKKTGSFKNLTNLRLGDLLTTYDGSSTNIGLTFIGGGYTTMTASNGATLKEGNGSILFIGPAGTPIGINSGIHHINFDMTISTNFKAAEVVYDSVKYVDGKTVEVNDSESKVESLDELLQLQLIED